VWQIEPKQAQISRRVASQRDINMTKNKLPLYIAGALALLVLPFILQGFGNAWVRIADVALLYVLLALGLNIVVGYAGLLDLGYVAFFALGAYMFGLLASPHLTETFPAIKAMFPDGLHTSFWIVVPLAALVAGAFGVILGDTESQVLA
jgi:branched-chain amino acid transport system permease protein